MPQDLDRLRAVIGDAYRLEELVGTGGMASVFRAIDLRHDRMVAIKVLRPELASELGIDRFTAEVKLTASLQHPHILPLHDSGGQGDLLFYVMPFVEGARTLRSRLETEGPMRVDEAVDIAVVVGGALEYAHQRGVVHRDIKPENILLSNGVPLVADFGIARIAKVEGAHVTGTGVSLGTPAYMSPEQAVGDPDVDARTDIYALGAMLFEMLAGEPPFGGSSVGIFKKLFSEPAPPLSARRLDVPPELAAAVARALEKEKSQRFASAAEFVKSMRGTGERVVPVSATSVPELPSVAVLPLANVGNDPELDYFCDGMTDELISTLSRLRGVRVASRTSAFSFKGRGATVEEIGRVLNVSYVLEGSVRHAGTRVRINAQLIEVRTQHQKWADRFDRNLDDVFALQDELAVTIADALSIRLSTSAGEDVTGVRRGTQSLPAYELVLKGRYFWNQRALDKAMECFQQAVKLDANFAQAWAGLADGFSFLSYYGALPPQAAFDRGRSATERAVDADPTLPEAQYARGLFELLLGHDLELSGRALRHAVELGPRQGASHATLCQWFAFNADREASHRAAESALKLEPLSPLVAATVAWAAVLTGEPDRAERLAQRGLELAADSLPCMWTIGGAHLERDNVAEALKWFGRAVERSGRLPYMVSLHGHAAARAGDEATARAALHEISTRSDGPRPGLAAWIHVGLGEIEPAIKLLLQALQEHDPHALTPLAMLRSGRVVLDDPRYSEALERAGLAEVHGRRMALLD